MSFCVIVPIAQMAAVNQALADQGFGGRNFAVPCYGSTGITHAAMHSWDIPEFVAAVKALSGVVWDDEPGDPVAKTAAMIAAQGAVWGDQAPQLPDSGNVAANAMYQRDGQVWRVIQAHNRTTFGGNPAQYPALVRQIRNPYTVTAWRQPIDAFDAYKLENPFTGRPDECTHNGRTWRVSQADGSGNNVWEPGVFGWVEVVNGQVVAAPAPAPAAAPAPAPAPASQPAAWVQPTGAHDAYRLGALVTYQGSTWENTGSDANVWAPGVFGWTRR